MSEWRREREKLRDSDRERDRDRDRDRERYRNRDRDRERNRDRDHRQRSRSRSTERHRRRHHRRSPSADAHRHKRLREGSDDDRDRRRSSASEHAEGGPKEQKKLAGDDQRGGEAASPTDADPDEVEMMKILGIPLGFDSTKGQPVAGNDVSGVRAVTKRQPRQYMNRRGRDVMCSSQYYLLDEMPVVSYLLVSCTKTQP
ncbi:hypothetical protein OPV22_011421 [Ensete ventricosum]|uniref:U4/U6.U5 small nuclear ribonucleoprotein 27kDa protein domain-containing protein n=1 Tax=Ensete ventricosum TaxID=4639 RepID=A0AAV8RF98_ENSVE|nr:hypothetical protein OPV22_011421 [Ensete ventricosum]